MCSTEIPESGEAVAQAPTDVPVIATATTLPTATPTRVPPTATTPPTVAPTAVPTEVADAAASDPLAQTIALIEQTGGVSRGQALFQNQTWVADDGVEWQCTSCHNYEVPEVKIGPSLLGIPEHAAERVEDEGPYTYIFRSIRYPQEYIVAGFEDSTRMPHFTTESLSDNQIYDIISYLMTLHDDSS